MQVIYRIILIPIFILSLLTTAAQDYADSTFYLVDSLDLNQINEKELPMIDSCLHAFAQAPHDTLKIEAVNFIIENSWDNDVWPRYNNWVHQFIQNKLKQTNTAEVEKFLRTNLAASYNNMGYLSGEQGDIEEQLIYYKKSLSLFEELKDLSNQAICFNNIGYAYDSKNDHKKAIEYYEKSAKIHAQLGNEIQLAIAYNNLGAIYRNTGLITVAMEYYLKSYSIREKNNDQKGLTFTLNNIAFIYMDQNEIEKALAHFEQSLEISKKIEFDNSMAMSLNNIGLIYDKYGDPSCIQTSDTCTLQSLQKALTFYKQSLALDQKMGRKRESAISMNNVGGIYLQLAKLNSTQSTLIDTAQSYFVRANHIFKTIDHKHGVSMSLNNLSQTQIYTDHLNLALTYAKESLEIAQEIEYPADIQNAAEILTTIYEKQGNGIAALNMYRLSTKMKEQIYNEENQKSVMLQEMKYAFEKEQYIAQQKELEAQRIAQEQIDQRNTLQFSGISIGIFILFGAVFFLAKIQLPNWMIELSLFLPFLILFEFLLVILDSTIEDLSGGEPAYKLLINVFIAGLIFPLHSYLEHRVKRRLFKI